MWWRLIIREYNAIEWLWTLALVKVLRNLTHKGMRLKKVCWGVRWSPVFIVVSQSLLTPSGSVTGNYCIPIKLCFWCLAFILTRVSKYSVIEVLSLMGKTMNCMNINYSYDIFNTGRCASDLVVNGVFYLFVFFNFLIFRESHSFHESVFFDVLYSLYCLRFTVMCLFRPNREPQWPGLYRRPTRTRCPQTCRTLTTVTMRWEHLILSLVIPVWMFVKAITLVLMDILFWKAIFLSQGEK